MTATSNNKQQKINVKDINNIPDKYPENFFSWCKQNQIKLPKIKTKRGKALSLLLAYPNYYFTRNECNEVCEKFSIKTNDSIQLFNKVEQLGIKCYNVRGKYNIPKPYKTTNKNKMRQNFKFDGTFEDKNIQINNIKQHLKDYYINIPNDKWHLGHKNPDIDDNTSNNLVLQPPIQAKYRDNYIFIDTFTKIPTPKKIHKMIKKKECPYLNEQLIELRDLLNNLKL
jgi:hypothetical protein